MESNPRGVLIVCLSVVLGIIDLLAVVLRFIARRRSKSGLGLDDWFIAASLIPAYCMIIIAGFCDFFYTPIRPTLLLTRFLCRGHERRSR